MKIILLAGAPGSGKSTQGSGLHKMHSAIHHLSLGEVVRDILKNPEHHITLKYQSLISSGELLPDSIILEILKDELGKIKDTNAILLLDGYPRTLSQYEAFKQHWGIPDGLIHLNYSEEILTERLKNRTSSRCDDNDSAIIKRLSFYNKTTLPVLESIKKELGNNVITIQQDNSAKVTTHLLFSQLHRIPSVHQLLSKISLKREKTVTNPAIKPIWAYSVFSNLWNSFSEYQTLDVIQKDYETQNFSFSMLGKKIFYLETASEVGAVLNARTNLGPVYRHFSMASGLKYDFLATDAEDSSSYRFGNNQVNVWKLIHNTLGSALKHDRDRVVQLMDKHLDQTFFAEKTFDLDTTFDAFFCSFWSEYLFGPKVSGAVYRENRENLLAAMGKCFYSNNYKALDPTGLLSFAYSYSVSNEIKIAKDKIKLFINQSTPNSLVQRFKLALQQQNDSEKLGLSEETIMEILADNVYDLIFEPDFLENVMYESLVAAITENADLHEKESRNYVYGRGLNNGYLFPIRTRILSESLTLNDGTEIPQGSYVYLNLKKAGLYHSTGSRRCVGQAYSNYFKEHLFDRLASIAFNVKNVSYPEERKAKLTNENIPVSPERYQVSWHLKRDEAMRHLSFHNYKGNKFFDVLGLHQKPILNTQMVKQCVLKIQRLLEKKNINLNDAVIVTPEVRGIPIAATVADHLKIPLYTIRKKNGYKMASSEVYTESYDKGYGDIDTVEFPVSYVKSLFGKKVIFLDDGIASGESALACIRLLENHGEIDKKPIEVLMVMSLLKHDYVAVDPKLSKHKLVKTLFDCNGGKYPSETPKTEHVSDLNI